MSHFRCSHCKAYWGFPDLTVEQARAENRDICPRCRFVGEVGPGKRFLDFLRGK